jgi:large subunit ribosomal protein L2
MAVSPSAIAAVAHRRYIRLVDFKREKHGIPAKVAAIEYDPNRTARLALLFYADGEKRYIIAPLDLKVGDTVMSGPTAEIRTGNSLPISNIPVGTLIHNIEVQGWQGRQLVRSAGGAAQLLAKEGDFAQIRMPSGEVRLIHQVVTRRLVRLEISTTAMSNLVKQGASAT